MATKAKPKTFTKHPDAIAWDKWLEEHANTTDPTTLKAPADQRFYLENRLAAAFQAGVEHGRRCPNP
jgi:hypothetical protein